MPRPLERSIPSKPLAFKARRFGDIASFDLDRLCRAAEVGTVLATRPRLVEPRAGRFDLIGEIGNGDLFASDEHRDRHEYIDGAEQRAVDTHVLAAQRALFRTETSASTRASNRSRIVLD